MGYDLILAAVDTSFLKSIVFEHSLETAKLHQAELKFLHCVKEEISPSNTSAVSVVGTPLGASYHSPSGIDFQIVRQAREDRFAEVEEWLQEYCRRAEQQGVKSTCEVVLGNPEDHVCDLAQAWQTDLIVVGRQGRTGLTEFFLGSVSNHVVHHAHCSVLVVQGKGAVSSKSI